MVGVYTRVTRIRHHVACTNAVSVLVVTNITMIVILHARAVYAASRSSVCPQISTLNGSDAAENCSGHH